MDSVKIKYLFVLNIPQTYNKPHDLSNHFGAVTKFAFIKCFVAAWRRK